MDDNTYYNDGDMSSQEVNDMIALSITGWTLGSEDRYAGGVVDERRPQLRREIRIGTVPYTQHVYFHKSDHGNWHTICRFDGTIDNKIFATLTEAAAYLEGWKPSVEMQLHHLNQTVHRLNAGLNEVMENTHDFKKFKDEVSAFIKRGMTGTIKLD